MEVVSNNETCILSFTNFFTVTLSKKSDTTQFVFYMQEVTGSIHVNVHQYAREHVV
jgi:hypothetical protein